jgi:hypothetical protein
LEVFNVRLDVVEVGGKFVERSELIGPPGVHCVTLHMGDAIIASRRCDEETSV